MPAENVPVLTKVGLANSVTYQIVLDTRLTAMALEAVTSQLTHQVVIVTTDTWVRLARASASMAIRTRMGQNVSVIVVIPGIAALKPAVVEDHASTTLACVTQDGGVSFNFK